MIQKIKNNNKYLISELMKRIFIAALCLATAGSLFAQKKVVDQANKLAGKPDKIEEARSLIQQAMQDPETANDARTYYVAGLIEWKTYDSVAMAKQLGQQLPEDVDNEISDQLLAGYDYFQKALELDKIPNEKGKTLQYTKDINNQIVGHCKDFWMVGAQKFNSHHYYPDAYKGFYLAGAISQEPTNGKAVTILADTVIPQSYLYAGQAAYAGKAVPQALGAFKKATDAGINDPNAYVYQIACWEYLAKEDSTLEAKSKEEIYNVSKEGYAKFGDTPSIFLSQIVDHLANDGKSQEAMDIVNAKLAEKETALLYRLRGWLNGHMDKDDELVADYLKAASMPDADAEILYNSANVIYRYVSNKNGALTGNTAEEQAIRRDLKANYLEPAEGFAQKAKQLDTDGMYRNKIANLLDNIDYLMEQLH
jgi:hypothetical protein